MRKYPLCFSELLRTMRSVSEKLTDRTRTVPGNRCVSGGNKMDQKYEALHKRVQAVLVPALDRAGYTVVTDIQTDESRETGDPTVRLVIRDESAGLSCGLWWKIC